MKILHLTREIEDVRALETAREQLRTGHEVTLLLLHDAVLGDPLFEGRVLACADDVVARGGRRAHEAMGYGEIVRLICEHDRVICW